MEGVRHTGQAPRDLTEGPTDPTSSMSLSPPRRPPSPGSCKSATGVHTSAHGPTAAGRPLRQTRGVQASESRREGRQGLESPGVEGGVTHHICKKDPPARRTCHGGLCEPKRDEQGGER